jgi:hypothetical protein
LNLSLRLTRKEVSMCIPACSGGRTTIGLRQQDQIV